MRQTKTVYAKATTVKKAAMFGLDARIALTIFGALSVISGAALYSAIQGSKVTAFITYANEYGKAWEQFYLDTGTKLTYINADTSNSYYYYRKMTDLVINSGIVGWKGPYLSESEVTGAWPAGTALSFNNSNDYRVSIAYMRDPTASTYPAVYCYSGSTDCSLWIQIVSNDDVRDFIKALDKKIDRVESATSGNFQYLTSASYECFFIKYIAIANPVDHP